MPMDVFLQAHDVPCDPQNPKSSAQNSNPVLHFVFCLCRPSARLGALAFFSGLLLLPLARAAFVFAQTPAKCGFPEIAALHAASAHEARARSLLKAAAQRPVLPLSYITPDRRFKIHYTVIGPDAVDPTSTNSAGVPDFVYEAGLAAQRAYHLLADSLGLRLYANDNGVDGPELDFYLNNRPGTEYGRTIPEFAGSNGPAYCIIDNDFGAGYYTQGLNGLRVTVAHEYFHAVQLNYYFRGEDIYFFELCSVWFEDYAYDHINDYYDYLRSWFRNTRLALNVSDGAHEYGSSIWLHYLVKRLGTTAIVRDLWEGVESDYAVFATRQVLQSPPYLLPFQQAMHEFYNWCFFTGYRADADKYFEEGENYPLLPFNATNSFRVSEQASHVDSLPSLAARYYRFIRAGLDLQFRVEVSAEPARWGLTAIAADAQENYLLKTDRALATISVAGQDREDTVYAVVANAGLPPHPDDFPLTTFRLQVDLGEQQELPQMLEKPRPNPVRVSRGDILIVPYRIKARVEVEAFICREDGRVIWSKNYGQLPAGPHEVIWNGVNADGSAAGSGVYVMRLLAGGLVESTKFVLIRH